MGGELNLVSIYLTNCLGIIMCIIIIASGAWKLTEDRYENKLLIYMVACILIACFAEPIAFTFDGVPGIASKILGYLSNTWLYFANIVTCYCWFNILKTHLNIEVHPVHYAIIRIALAAALVCLPINLFIPIAFSIDENNVYQRGTIFAIYMVLNVLVMTDSIILYFKERRKSGGVKFFPVWMYVVPGYFGMLVQTLYYGVSIIWPCAALASCGLVISLQTERILKDKLTGLYNRFFLDYIKGVISKSKHSVYTMMMLDLNGFKGINDNYGHDEGDRALVKISELLTSSIGSMGTVIRYAGDEFIVVLNTQNDKVISAKKDGIQHAIEEYNNEKIVPYTLSISLGYCKADLKIMTIDDVLNKVDKLMYEAKAAYYSQFPVNERRQHA